MNGSDDYPRKEQPDPSMIPCPACRQTGLNAYPPIGMKCRVCDGKGWISMADYERFTWVECELCGRPKREYTPCIPCAKGQG